MVTMMCLDACPAFAAHVLRLYHPALELPLQLLQCIHASANDWPLQI